MFALGAGLLGHGLLPAADREVVIARVTARAGCGYEWGVHAATLARQAGLTPDACGRPPPRRSTTRGRPATRRCWPPSTSCTTRRGCRSPPGRPCASTTGTSSCSNSSS
ncbi:carboxymuconolactone decarboxylase family protein [Nonomuraea thailandensis]